MNRFAYRKNSKDGHHYTCKDCSKLSAKKSYAARPKHFVEATLRRRAGLSRKEELVTTKLRQQQRKREAIAYKGGKCEDCGGLFHQAAYDFHHLDPSQKDFNIATKLGRGWTIEKIKNELDKCALLCANCHRIRHASEVK